MLDRVMAEFDSVEAMLRAAERVRALGIEKVDAYSPFPIPEVEEILGIRRTRIPRIAFAVGATGGIAALVFQWWANEVAYPLNVGGRSLFPARIPIGFEVTVLTAAIAIVVTVLVRSRMPRLHDRIFDTPGFESASVDHFWLSVEGGVEVEVRAALAGAIAIHDGGPS